MVPTGRTLLGRVACQGSRFGSPRPPNVAAGRRCGMRRVSAVTAVLALCAAVLTGCGLSIPTDPDGTLDRVTGDVLRVGASPSGELVVVSSTDAVSGPLPDLV